MSIIRGPRPESGWYALDKRISEDARLSWAARGMLVFLLGKPDHWEVSIEHLRQQTAGARIKSGRDALYGLLGELEDAGYLEREQVNDGGRFGSTRYVVREIPAPVYKEQAALPLPENPDTVEPRPAEPCTDEPYTAEPCTANPTVVKTDISAKNEPKQGRAKRAPAPPFELPDWVPADLWASWLEVRKKIRAPNTPDAMRLNLRKLEQFRDAGQNPRAILEQAIERGWRGLFPVKPEYSNGTAHTSQRRESVAERAERINREHDIREGLL